MYNNCVIGYIANQYNEYCNELEYNNKIISNNSLLIAKQEQNKRRKEESISQELEAKKEYEDMLKRKEANNYYGLIDLYNYYVIKRKNNK